MLSEATGVDVEDFAAERLFSAIGASASMTSDAAGNALTYQGATASCDDMARFG